MSSMPQRVDCVRSDASIADMIRVVKRNDQPLEHREFRPRVRALVDGEARPRRERATAERGGAGPCAEAV
jgi:hypothetical protein